MNYYNAVLNDYWLLGHKSDFDGPNKLIYVSPYITSLNIKTDLYSDWKEWKSLRDNAKFLPAMRGIGGDPTTGTEFAGDIYFTINGWKVVVDLSQVQITGVLFSDDFVSAWVNNNLNFVYPALAASLVNTIQPSLEGLGIPTSTENASAVRTELNTELTRIDTTISSRASQASVDTIETKVDTVIVTLGNMSGVLDDLIKYQGNKTLIDPNAFTLTIYEDDGITPLKVFDLQNADGIASITDIYRRIPR